MFVALSHLLLGSITIGMLLLSAACRPSSADPPPGYLTIAIESNPLQLDPRYATDANSVRIGNLIYNSLLRADQKSQLQPELAENWRMVDEKTYFFELRRDARFHDGRPLTAVDVKFTYESILDPTSRSPKRGLLKPLHAVEQIGPYQLKFALDSVHAPFVEQFTLGIVPAGSSTREPPNFQPPLGSGPFMVQSIESGERVLLKANPSAWQGKPSLAGLIFKVVPDAMVRVLEFQKGAVDFMQNDLEPDMLPWLRQNTNANVGSVLGTTYQYIGINFTHPILRYKKVRQALAYAIDREAIVQYLRRGLATPAVGLLPPASWAFTPDVTNFLYDPARARALLDEAGFRDPDGPGPEPRLRLTLKVSNIEFNRLQSAVIQEDLRKVGVALDVRMYEFATLYADVVKGNFQMFALQWVGGALADPDILRVVFHSSQAPPVGFNRGFFADPQTDALLEEAARSIDEGSRRELFARAQRRLAEQVPYISLWTKRNVAIAQRSLRGIHLSPIADFLFLPDVERIPVSVSR